MKLIKITIHDMRNKLILSEKATESRVVEILKGLGVFPHYMEKAISWMQNGTGNSFNLHNCNACARFTIIEVVVDRYRLIGTGERFADQQVFTGDKKIIESILSRVFYIDSYEEEFKAAENSPRKAIEIKDTQLSPGGVFNLEYLGTEPLIDEKGEA